MAAYSMRLTRRQVSRTASIQAPTGGLNAKDAIANMKETEAVTMDNWFPTPSSVDIRNGYASHVTGMGAVETLMSYINGATQNIFGISGGSIYDVTTAGAVGAAVVSGLTNSKFQHITMGTAGGYYLMAVNGADKLRYYNGTAWDFWLGAGSGAVTPPTSSPCEAAAQPGRGHRH